ncbi:PAS domain-containing sensor histidine kinase [Paenibacillaceae bacterium T2]|uniref:Sensor histidine kinase n=1 Tax=Ferviditalea candida TaxID=3108399 RepID=A0ABU5ZFP4_9BACL|nr:PAS domain-containing sensor histidine kinase [Paenibacillaceae bacterium T2]
MKNNGNPRHLSNYLKQIFDHIEDGIIIFDQERRILVMNPSSQKFTGWKVGGTVPYCSFCQTREVAPGENRCYLLSKREVPYFLASMPTYEGKYIEMELRTAVIYENEQQNRQEALLVLKDLSMKKREEEARISKLILQKTLEAQESEHKRLAQELHDGVGQSLYSISVGLQAIQANMHQAFQMEDYVRELVNALEKVIRDVKFYSWQLRPPSLDQLGLIPTVDHLIDNLRKTHPRIAFSFEHSGIRGRLSAILEINLYRVIQEAIHNALKYSQANKIKVEIRTKKDFLILSISDNGIGFDPSAANQGLGLKHMKERIDQLKGNLHIRSEPGCGGAKVVSVIPFKEENLID